MSERFDAAITRFDAYNSNDPNMDAFKTKWYPKEVLYAQRMSERLEQYAPGSAEYIRLAARCQHIGRWEIPRDSYPMDKKGYIQWRNTLKAHHAKIAEGILQETGYEQDVIEKVKFLLLKKELNKNADTQLLEDVICLVFIQYYLIEFASKHEDGKIIEILRKTMKKMTTRAINEVGKISLHDKLEGLIQAAAAE